MATFYGVGEVFSPYRKMQSMLGCVSRTWGRCHLSSLFPPGTPVWWTTWITVGGSHDDAFSENIDLTSYKYKKVLGGRLKFDKCDSDKERGS